MSEGNIEKKIVASALKSRAAWERISKACDTEDTFTPYSGLILKLIYKYYSRDAEALYVDRDIVEQWLKDSLPSKSHELYINHLKECSAIDTSALLVADLVVEAKQKAIGNELASALLDRRDIDKINKLLGEYTTLEETANAEEEEEIYSGISVAQVVEEQANQVGIVKLLPKELDKACRGKARLGHHIVLYARPETGKTALTLTLAWGFCLQGLDTIIFGNEEPVRDTIARAQSCFTGMTEEEIAKNPARAQKLLDERGWEHLRFIPLNPGTPAQIDKYLTRYKPQAFITDQIRNLLVRADTRVNQLEAAATSQRNLGKKHNALAVSVTQAGDSADQKLFLEMGDIDFSNTGIPATADLMVGLGVNKDYEAQGLRGISTPKNKVGGFHLHFPVKIRTDLSRLEDI